MDLERAIGIAVEAHRGQTDKNGGPYILHPLRVMLALDGTDAQIAGVLHDVVEDSPDWTIDRLREEGFSETVLSAIDAVTRRDGESYAEFVRRAVADQLGRRVKRADLLDNLDASRLREVSPKDTERLNRYLNALATVRAAAGDPD